MTLTRQLRVGLSASGEIALTIPSPSGGDHTVEVPCTADGLRLLRTTLQEHSRAPDAATLGTAASPTQCDVDALLRAFKPKPRPKAPAPAEVDLDALDFSSLKL